MKNERGFSWPEAITSLAILMLIATVLLPMVGQLSNSMEGKKRSYYASVVMHEAAKVFISTEERSGMMHIENIVYRYEISEKEVCVFYEGIREDESKCIHIT